MRSFTFFALMAMPLMVLANPIDSSVSRLTKLRTSNRVTQVKAGHRNKYKGMQKAYDRYAIAVPPAIQVAASAPIPEAVPSTSLVATNTSNVATPVQSGSVAALPEQYDEAYLSPVTIGRMNMNLDFDTGSSDLWVFSTDLPVPQQGNHALYMHHYGTQNVGSSWKISYGDGSTAAGTVWTDRVVVGPVTATTQAVEVATAVSSVFASGLSDGLLGLGFSNINQVRPTQVPTFMDNIASSLPQDLFSVSLKAGAPGTYDFGFIDPAKYTGGIAYAPVNNSRGYWGFNLDSYCIGAGSISTFTAAEQYTIADTGTSITWLPELLVLQYYNQIPGAQFSDSWGGMTFPCTSTLPPLTLYISGQPRTMPGSYLNYAPLNDGTGYCFGGIQDGSSSPGFNILGDTFLKSQYVVFDRTVPQIGFAAQA